MKKSLQRIKRGSISIHVSESEPHKQNDNHHLTAHQKTRSSSIRPQGGILPKRPHSLESGRVEMAQRAPARAGATPRQLQRLRLGVPSPNLMRGGKRQGAGRKPRETPREAITVRLEPEDAAKMKAICKHLKLSHAKWMSQKINEHN